MIAPVVNHPDGSPLDTSKPFSIPLNKPAEPDKSAEKKDQPPAAAATPAPDGKAPAPDGKAPPPAPDGNGMMSKVKGEFADLKKWIGEGIDKVKYSGTTKGI